MRRFLPLAALLCAAHGGGQSCEGCAHTSAGGGHYEAPSHFEGPNRYEGPSHFEGYSSAPAPAPRVAPSAVMASPPPVAVVSAPAQPLFRLHHEIDLAAQMIETVGEALGDMALNANVDGEGAPDAPADGLCRSYLDCGDGEMHHGTLCDRTFRGGDADAVGVCREACRDYHDCPALMRCVGKLDPQDPTWAGCVP